MKKYVLFMFGLILAACTTGNGPDDRFRVSSSSRYVYVKQIAADNNEKITKMASEIRVCADENCIKHNHNGNGSGLPTVTPRKSSYNDNTGNWNVYNLKDTEFVVTDNKTFTFIIDDNEKSDTRGQIMGIKIDNDEYVRNLNKSDEFTKDDTTFTYKSFSKSKELNLLFSDFGTLKQGNDTKYFVGGYKDDVFKHEAPTKSVSFTGNAIGVGSKNGGDLQNLDGSATLIFVAPTEETSLKETLTMNFDSYGKVEVAKEGNNERQIKFDDVAATGTLNPNINYYGSSTDNIQEAAGRIQYSGTDRTMDVVFGVTKDK